MEHPVAPMTDYITRSDLGTYEASASSYDSRNSLYPWEAFDRDTVTRWAINTPGNQYNQTTGNGTLRRFQLSQTFTPRMLVGPDTMVIGFN